MICQHHLWTRIHTKISAINSFVVVIGNRQLKTTPRPLRSKRIRYSTATERCVSWNWNGMEFMTSDGRWRFHIFRFSFANRYTDTITDCSKAIELDPKLVKGFYRRMQANEVLHNYDSALMDCKEVLKLDPKNAEAIQANKRLSDRIAGKSNFSLLPLKAFDVQCILHYRFVVSLTVECQRVVLVQTWCIG